MIAPDTATHPDASSEATENLFAIPAAALAIDGATPEPGDTVEFTVRGTISRAEGGELYVMPEMINDQPATLPPEAAAPTDEDPMMAAARKADDESAGMGY